MAAELPFLVDRAARGIDALNGWLGRMVRWVTLAMVLVASYNALARYLGRAAGIQLTSNALLEAQWYLFSMVFLLGAAYALRQDAHVRVDVIYDRLGARGRAWINLLGTVLFLLPFSVFMLLVCWGPVANSWAAREVSSDPGGLPRYPIKTLIPLAFALLILQGLAQAVRHVREIRGHNAAPPAPPAGEVPP
jgi:TRAP-type mannitol/chloroaromatic compound transport system permease small subunit